MTWTATLTEIIKTPFSVQVVIDYTDGNQTVTRQYNATNVDDAFIKNMVVNEIATLEAVAASTVTLIKGAKIDTKATVIAAAIPDPIV